MGLDQLRAAAAAVDAEDLSPRMLGERIVELRAVIDGLEGVWSRLVAAFDGSGAVEADAGTAAWLRSACRLSPAGILGLSKVQDPTTGTALSM